MIPVNFTFLITIHFSTLVKRRVSVFEPRPSPSFFDGLNNNVVFAVAGKLLHHYLLPRDYSRVCYYPTKRTTVADLEKFLYGNAAGYVMAVESGRYRQITATSLHVYEFAADHFKLLDDCAGYYVSNRSVAPIHVRRVDAILPQLLQLNIEVRFVPYLQEFARAVSESRLNFR